MNGLSRKFLFLAATLLALPLTDVLAQQSGDIQEVIVTARKRQESVMNVPVTETVLSQDMMDRYQTQDLKDIANLVPGLDLGDNLLSIGTQVSLRGVGTASFDPGIDQSVAMNIDGMQFSQGLAFQSGMFDMGQVEVLKGPQSLFFGKSSPGGVISIRTADPTDQYELIARAAYEIEALEKRGELIVSGPITDTLKARLAWTVDGQQGFYYNNAVAAPAFGALPPVSGRIGGESSFQGRGTVLWNPVNEFDARLKVNDVFDRTLYAGSEEWVSCPGGTAGPGGIPFLGGASCQRGREMQIVDYNPVAFPGALLNGGIPFFESSQFYTTLEMNYRVRPDVTLTSVTGYYNIHEQSLVDTYMSTSAAPPLSVTNHFKRDDITEEVRVNTDFDGPVNALVGGYLQRGGFADLVELGGNTFVGLPPVVEEGTNIVSTNTNSAFGQLRYKIIPEVEATVGVRWTDETRSDAPVDYVGGQGFPVSIPIPKIVSDTYSPEATLTYRPTTDLTVFGTVKRGFKSGSYDVATPAVPGVNIAFGDEKAQGFEIGVKSRLLDHRLTQNLSFFDYRYSGLQVGGITPANGGVPVITTLNAGAALGYGIDYDVTYRPPVIDGLSVLGGVEWDQAHFTSFDNAQCYGGQTIAQGCNLNFNPATRLYTAQNLTGSPLVRAPLWTVNFGLNYSASVGNDLALVFGNSNHYSSKFLTDLDYPYYQKDFIKVDLSVTIEDSHDRWEVAFIGKDLNNVLTSGDCANSDGNYAAFGGQVTGGTGKGPAGIDDIGCYMDRGRQLMVRLTVKPFN